MKHKLLKIWKSIVAFIDKRWQEITVCLLIAVLASQLYPIGVRTFNNVLSASARVTDWGLSFGDANTRPTGNMSSSELAKYNSFYIDKDDEKVIYLTFDAGYENGYMPKILDVLKEEQVPAAFFLVSHYFESAPELVLRMYQEGHTVGNHTASHPDMSKINDIESLKAELEPVEKQYKEITGSDMPKFYRPPQGKFCINNLEQASQLGYKTVFWSLAYVDWDVKNQPNANASIEKLCSRVHNGAVILLHSTSATNAEILQTLIQKWKNEGYTFKSLAELD